MSAPVQVPLSIPLGDVRGNKTVHLPMPKTRGECVNAQRPCPHIQCKYSLIGEIARHPNFDAAVAAFEAREEAGCTDTCALDVADRGETTEAEVATLLGVSRQRVQQICDEAGFYARRFSTREQFEVRDLLQTSEAMRAR